MALFNININEAINEPPVVGDGEANTEYGTPIILTRSHFTTNTTPPYFDPEGDLPLNLKIDSLPTSGKLQLNGVDVVINQEISFIDEIDLNHLTYLPDVNNQLAHSTSFNFSISDEGSQVYTS